MTNNRKIQKNTKNINILFSLLFLPFLELTSIIRRAFSRAFDGGSHCWVIVFLLLFFFDSKDELEAAAMISELGMKFCIGMIFVILRWFFLKWRSFFVSYFIRIYIRFFKQSVRVQDNLVFLYFQNWFFSYFSYFSSIFLIIRFFNNLAETNQVSIINLQSLWK